MQEDKKIAFKTCLFDLNLTDKKDGFIEVCQKHYYSGTSSAVAGLHV